MIDARGAEIFANGLQRIAKFSAMPLGVPFGVEHVRPIRDRPQVQQVSLTAARRGWLRMATGTRNRSGTIEAAALRRGVRNEGHAGLVKALAEAFVVREKKCLVFLNRPAHGAAKLVSLKRRRGAHIEEVWRIQRIVAQILKGRAVPLIRAGLRDDRDLAARMLSVFGAIRILQQG